MTVARERDPAAVAAFIGGRVPDDSLIDAIDGAPFWIRVRPDLLDPEAAEHLFARGCTGIELDVATLDDEALARTGRPYDAARVLRMAAALRRRGRVGAVLAPGWPYTSTEIAMSDARRLVGHVDRVRLHPVLVLLGSRLEGLHRNGLYAPLSLGEAVSLCRALLDVLEGAGIDVVRVGLHPEADGFGRALAGPRHPALREAAEALRALAAVRAELAAVPRGADVTVYCAPCDETRTRGPLNENVRTLRADLALSEVSIVPDAELARGAWRVAVR